MSIFSLEFCDYTAARYAARANYLHPIASDVEGAIAALAAEDEDAALLLRYWMATLPLTDVFDTPLAVLHSFALRAAELRRNSPWCKDAPEDIFVHYVASPRVNNEPITDCWGVFHDALAARLAGKGAYEAVIETNYWCCETATYQASDARTLGPLGVLSSGSGRCGEESTYLVTALRANGIPARQIYTPWWAHCDDNHAWVEAYVDDSWHYLGACEPDEELDRGWFTAAAGRAMLVHTRLFSDYACDFNRDGALLAREGSQIIVNVTGSYAPSTTLTVRVVDEAGAPVSGACVQLGILNESSWRSIAQLSSNSAGTANIVIGRGSLRVFVATQTSIGDAFVNTEDSTEVTVVLRPIETAVGAEADWQSFDHIAPGDHPAPSHPLTTEQAQQGRVRKHEADGLRIARVKSATEAALSLADENTASDGVTRFFECAFSNASEVARFLAGGSEADRTQMLSTLTDKDFRDLKADILEDHLAGARAVKDAAFEYLRREGAPESKLEELYVSYVLCPRVHFEHLSPWRSFIRSYFDAATAEGFRSDPASVWDYVTTRTCFDAGEHVKKLAGTPKGALLSQQASPVTAHVLFVAICRSFGIPARVNRVDGAVEYYAHGSFVPLEVPERTVAVPFSSTASEAPGYFQKWSLARLETSPDTAGNPAACYVEMDLTREIQFEDGVCTGPLPFGTYRLTTGVRLPNGNVQAYERSFKVNGTTRAEPIELKLREPSASELLEDIKLDPFTLGDGKGFTVNPVAVANMSGTDAHPVAVMFLEPSMEPTEHLLNELREQADRVEEAALPLLFVVKDEAELSDPTLSRTLAALATAQTTIAYDDFSELPEKLARRMFANPEKLPLTVLALAQNDGSLHGVYATAGYNVGTVDLMLQLLRLV